MSSLFDTNSARFCLLNCLLFDRGNGLGEADNACIVKCQQSILDPDSACECLVRIGRRLTARWNLSQRSFKRIPGLAVDSPDFETETKTQGGGNAGSCLCFQKPATASVDGMPYVALRLVRGNVYSPMETCQGAANIEHNVYGVILQLGGNVGHGRHLGSRSSTVGNPNKVQMGRKRIWLGKTRNVIGF